MHELPEGWEWKKLGEVCEITTGKWDANHADENGKYRFYTCAFDYMFCATNRFSGECIILPGNGANVGEVFYYNGEFDAYQRTYVIQNIKIYPKYLYYHLMLNWRKGTDAKQYGSATNYIRIGNFHDYIVTLPPLSIQQAIVTKIEEIFSELDHGVAQLKLAQQQLKVYRQSVLKWAFEGRLTNAGVKDGELVEGWKWVKIEEIASVGTGATPLKNKKEYYENGKIAWVTSGALNDDFVNKATEFVTEKALKETNLSVYPKGTLLLAMYGEGKTRGKCSELQIEACTNQAIAAIYFEKHDVRVKPFLKYFLHKNYGDIRKLSSGGVQPNLNLGIVKKTLFPFPPIKEQHQIIAEIERRLSVCDKLEETIVGSLKAAEVLRAGVLKRAFEGKLV